MATLGSDNQFPKLLLTNDGDSATPSTGFAKLYVNASKVLHYKDDTGTDVALGTTSITLAFSKISRTNIGSNLTVASTTWADMDATNLAPSITTGAHRVECFLTGRVSNSGTGLTRFGFTYDGTAFETEATGSTGNGIVGEPVAGTSMGLLAYGISPVLTAASHTFKPRWNASAGTSTAYQTASSDFLILVVKETLFTT